MLQKRNKIIKYILLRGFSYILNLVLIILFVEILNTNPQFSFIVSTLLIMVLNFYITTIVIFRSKVDDINIYRYFFIVIIAILLSSYFLDPIMEKFSVNYLMASAISITTLTLFKFILLDKFVYKA